MGEERGWVRLRYTTTNHWTGQTTQHDYTRGADHHTPALRRPPLVVGLPTTR